MIINSRAPRPEKAYENKVVVEESKKETKATVKAKEAPLTEDELINKIIKGEG